jgi:hypothetical protein
MNMVISNGDTVITHTSPSFCKLSSHFGLLDWAERDETLLEDVEHERKVMDSLYDYLYKKNHPIRHWLYGHFHQSWHCEIDGIIYDMLAPFLGVKLGVDFGLTPR